MSAQPDAVAQHAHSAGEPASSGPQPEFEVLGARPLRYAAAPTLIVDLQISEPSGRQVYMMALTIQLMLEPARRGYDDAAREQLTGLFGARERWAVTTRSLVWTRLDLVVPAFTGSTTVAVPVPCGYDLEIAAAKYLDALADGEVPLALHFNGMVYYANEQGGLQMVLVPWSSSIDYRMPVRVWRETIEHYYPNTGWLTLRSQTLRSLERERVRRALPTYDACIEQLLGGQRDG